MNIVHDDMFVQNVQSVQPTLALALLAHSVQFAILDLPLFGERKNYHQLLPLFWLEMVHMMGLSIIIKKKVWESVGKHVFPPLFAFP